MSKLIRLSFLPHAHNLALLLLRVGLGTSLFLKHGLEKVTGFEEMAKHFPDPLGIGATASLAYALISDAVCALLLIIGLGTRWAALLILINTVVAFAFVHHFHFFGERNGEMAWLYMVGAQALFLSGAGKFSVDHGLAGHGGEHYHREGKASRRKAAGER